jgi:hypothetical protein
MPRTPWIDDATNEPLIDEQSRKLESFVSTFADGRVDADELEAQERRLTDLLRELEPLLDDTLHEKVTRLMCELNAYAVMQIAVAIDDARPATTFRG